MGITARTEESPAYRVEPDPAARDDEIIARALAILARRVATGPVMESPNATRQCLQLRLGGLEHEVFAVMFLDAHHRVIETLDMFNGTLSATSVYPREVVKAALRLNAGAVVLAHNHPSGCAEPSHADYALTQTLKSALGLVDVRVLDHIIVSPSETMSFAERGLL